DGALRAVRRQPGDLVLKLARKPGTVPRPSDARDHDTVLAAGDPRRRRFDERLRRSQVERAPAAPARAPVVARRPPTATAAAHRIPPPRPRPHQQPLLLDLHALDYRPLEPEQASEYAPSAHAVTCLPREPTWKPETLGAERRAPTYRPTDRLGP